MKYCFNFLCSVAVLILIQSCGKKDKATDPQIDHFTFGAKFNWKEDVIKTDKEGSWVKISNGNIFSWLAKDSTLRGSNFALYSVRTNLKADFVYTIQPDSVFAIKQLADSVFFLDKNGLQRTDIKGRVTFSPDTSLILVNAGVSPEIMIKYRLEK